MKMTKGIRLILGYAWFVSNMQHFGSNCVQAFNLKFRSGKKNAEYHPLENGEVSQILYNLVWRVNIKFKKDFYLL